MCLSVYIKCAKVYLMKLSIILLNINEILISYCYFPAVPGVFKNLT